MVLTRIVLLLLVSFIFASANGQDFENLNFGTDSTFDIATWNIENFPKNGQTTIDYVTEIIYALDLDYIAMQEVDSPEMFENFIEQLQGYNGYYQENNYARLAVIYKTDVLTVNSIHQIFTSASYTNPFPRPPIVMDVEFMGQQYILINNHWKCCGDGYLDLNNPYDQENRRWQASNLLKDFMDASYPNAHVIMLGDLNDDLTDPPAHNVFQNFLDDAENYRFVDMEIALGPSANWSYPSWPSHLDHILVSKELFDEVEHPDTEVACIKLDSFFQGGWSAYNYNVSDHRPVALRFKPNQDPVIVEEKQKIKTVYFYNYPNPAQHETLFEWGDEVGLNGKIRIINNQGQKVKEIEWKGKKNEIKWEINVKAGLYFAQLMTDERVVAVLKIMVQ